MLLACGIAALLQAIADRHSRRWDLTPSRALSLSELSQRVLDELPGPIHATAFTSRDEASRVAERMRLFAGAAPRFRFELVDLDRNPGRARAVGVDRYDRAVLSYGGRSVVVDATREPAITAGLSRLARGRSTRIAFLQGHGEAELDDPLRPAGLGLARQALEGETYEVGVLRLVEGAEVPEHLDLVIVAGPKRDLLEFEARSLDAHLERGGRLLLLLDPVTLPALSALATKRGIETPIGTIVDRTNPLFGSEPFTVLVPRYSPHPLTTSSTVPALFSVARPTIPTRLAGSAHAESVAATYPEASALRGRDGTRPLDPSGESDLRGPIPVVAASSWPAGRGEGRLVVAGDSDFATNGLLDLLGNRDLLLNAIAWTVAAEGRVAERPRSATEALRPLSPLVLSQRAGRWIFLSLVVLQPACAAAIGAGLLVRRRAGR